MGKHFPSLQQTDLFESPDTNTTGWTPPEEFPRLHGAIALDLETQDPGLKQYGPGWPVNNGMVVGVAIATATTQWYFPTRHAPGGNLNPAMVTRWLKDQLPNVSEVRMHNAQYDVGWLRTLDIHLTNRVVDTQAMVTLLDENRTSYRLNSCGKDYLGREKATPLLDAYAKRWGMGGDTGANIWRMPPFVVGPYAEQDARLTYDLVELLRPQLRDEGLDRVMAMEMELLHVLVAMRARGVRVDVAACERLREDLIAQEADLRDAIKASTGKAVDPWDVDSVAAALGTRGIVCGRTASGAVSVTKEFLAACSDPVAAQVLDLRRVNKLRSTFVEGAFLAHLQGDRIYPELHPLRNDRGGARTGRFSSSNPNAQQFPARREEEARLVRGLILPEQGAQWYAGDYSQQEPRMLVHFASLMGLPKAREARDAYRSDPNTDFHAWVAQLTELKRSVAKNINLGKFYGMGGAKYARSVGLPTKWITTRSGNRVEVAGDEAQAQLDQYDSKMPFVKLLYDRTEQVARERGYVRTILGRRRRFAPVYERGTSPHKALNAVVQGSSAEQNKLAMIALHRAGMTPTLAVHDEIDGSTVPDAVETIRAIMCDCLTLEVPSKVDLALGANWGEAL